MRNIDIRQSQWVRRACYRHLRRDRGHGVNASSALHVFLNIPVDEALQRSGWPKIRNGVAYALILPTVVMSGILGSLQAAARKFVWTIIWPAFGDPVREACSMVGIIAQRKIQHNRVEPPLRPSFYDDYRHANRASGLCCPYEQPFQSIRNSGNLFPDKRHIDNAVIGE